MNNNLVMNIVPEVRPRMIQNSAYFLHVSLTHNFEYNYDSPHPIATKSENSSEERKR